MIPQHPANGEAISSVEAWQLMAGELEELRGEDIWIFSAYLKLNALQEFGARVHASNRVIIVARWQSSDLLSGSSDLEAYDYAYSLGWEFRVRTDLHAKAYRLGSRSLYIGSANLTQSGFCLNVSGNAEIMVHVELTEGSSLFLVDILSRSYVLNQEVVASLKAWLLEFKIIEDELDSVENYPLASYINLLNASGNSPSVLLVSECLIFGPEKIIGFPELAFDNLPNELQHDLSLLGLAEPRQSKITPKVLYMQFLKTAAFRWLLNAIKESPKQQLYFGEVSSSLQSSLVDDPRPYRGEVKAILATLLAWVKYFPECEIAVDRPHYSERIYLKSE